MSSLIEHLMPDSWIAHWNERKERIAKERFNDGFDWAAGVILRKEMTPAKVEQQLNLFVYPLDYPWERDIKEFDLGALEAIRILSKKI